MVGQCWEKCKLLMICLETFEREARTTEYLASSRKFPWPGCRQQVSSSPPYWVCSDFWLRMLSQVKRNTPACLGLDLPAQPGRDPMRSLDWSNRLNCPTKGKSHFFFFPLLQSKWFHPSLQCTRRSCWFDPSIASRKLNQQNSELLSAGLTCWTQLPKGQVKAWAGRGGTTRSGIGCTAKPDASPISRIHSSLLNTRPHQEKKNLSLALF